MASMSRRAAFMQMQGVTNDQGRATFVFGQILAKPPVVLPILKYLAAAGCTAFIVGDPTKTSCTIEVRRPKALALGLVGVAHEPAPGVTVQILALLLD